MSCAMDRTCRHEHIKQTISLICTDIGTVAGLPDIDITKWMGTNVTVSCTDENVKRDNRRFGLCSKTAHQNLISDVQMYIYTNPALLDREELFAYLVDSVGRRGIQSDGHEKQINGNLDTLIHDHNEQFRMHRQRIKDRENTKHMLRLQQNKDLLRHLLMPKTLSTRFLLQTHRTISHLLSLSVLEDSLKQIQDIIITVPTTFDHSTQDLYKIGVVNSQYVHVENCANTILPEALNAFFPPHYACWDKDNPLSHSMQPLLDCYRRNYMNSMVDESWHDQMKIAYTMQDYNGLLCVEDILIAMVNKGDNIIPTQLEDDHRIINDVALLRFIMCVLFVVYVCNKCKKFCKPFSFTRVDNPANIIFHSPSSKHVYDIAPGKLFCHGGFLYIRRPNSHHAATVLRSKCILSLVLKLCTD